MATGTETTPVTGKGHEQLVPAVRTAYPRETLLEIAAFQELLDDRANDRTPKTLALLVALFIDGLKLRVKPFDQLIKGRLFGLARPIKAAGLVLAWHRVHSCGAANGTPAR
jgi:hypothetical protein